MNYPFLKSTLGDSPVVVEAFFEADPSRVYAAWITPSDIQMWFGRDEGGPEEVALNLEINGEWRFAFAKQQGRQDILSGRYIEIDPNKKLVFSWMHTLLHEDGESEVSPESTVSLTFEPQHHGTLLTLEHSSISTESARMNIGGGWNNSLAKLQQLVS